MFYLQIIFYLINLLQFTTDLIMSIFHVQILSSQMNTIFINLIIISFLFIKHFSLE